MHFSGDQLSLNAISVLQFMFRICFPSFYSRNGKWIRRAIPTAIAFFLKSLLMCTSYESVYASLMLLELVFSQVHPCSYLRVEL